MAEALGSLFKIKNTKQKKDIGSKVRLEVQQPIENKGNLDELVKQIEASVVSGVNSFK